MSSSDQQGQGAPQGDRLPQPTVQQPSETPQPSQEQPAAADQPDWVAPDYGISWATKSAQPPAGEEKRG
jgi:hypothetical protein